jgi:hypothetical protein
MNQEDANVELLREAYLKWHETRGGSANHWLERMADNIRFQSLAGGAPRMEFTRTSTSKSDVRGYFSQLTSQWEMIYFTVDEFIAQGDRVVALIRCSFRNRETGKVLETAKADVHRFRSGKICEFFEYYDTAGAIAAATPG